MNIDESISFLKHFKGGLYIKTVVPPFIHGRFKKVESFEQALTELSEDRTLYYVGHDLVDVDFVPLDSFGPIPKGQSVKSENIEKLRYFTLDIDPVNNTEEVDGKKVKRNLTVAENQAVVDEAAALRTELLNDGFTNIGLINSGNGAYLFFPFTGVKKPDESIQILKKFVNILKKRYSFVNAQIDDSTVKTTQCFKLPGTMSTKGEPTAENPFRHAVIIEDWDANESCWKTIKAYVEKYSVDDLVISTSSGDKLNLKACMQHCLKFYPVFRGENHDYRVRVEDKGKSRDLKLDSIDFASELRIHLRSETGILDIDKGDIDAIVTYLKDEAYQKDISVLASRVHYDEDSNTVYYDMCNEKDVVEITSTEISMKPKQMGMFDQGPMDKEQVQYVETPAKDLPKLLDKVANVAGNNLIILAVFLCVCFLGNFFPTPILLITGPQGTSKSTLTRFIQRIVHPLRINSLSLSSNVKDISIALSTRLLTCFDNAGTISAEVANTLCSSVTGGCHQTRELFTTVDERITEYVSIIVINGIEIISRRTDLMERCIMIELDPIKPENRKTEKQVEANFAAHLPMILGAIFDAIKQVLAMGEIELPTLSRMADFEEWATKFAITMGYTADEFQKALMVNQQRLIDAVSFGNPVIFAVVELMHGKGEFNCPFQDFYVKCYDILKQKATPNELAMFPKNPSTLSRALGGLEQNLKAFGLTFKSENIGPYKEARLTNDGSVIPNCSAGEVAGKLAYEKDTQTK